MISTYGKTDAETVLIQMVDTHDLEEMGSEVSEIKKLSSRDFCLTAVKIHNWNRDLSPWHASAMFGNEDFGDGAPDMLSEVLKICTDQKKRYIIGGYSLAGLFSLWAVYQTDVFRAAAAASPSLWFPGFIDYMRENRIHTGSVYLSLGDREEKTRNTLMASVGNRIREAHAILDDRGIETTLEWNPGNHFRDTGVRMAKAFAWVLNRQP